MTTFDVAPSVTVYIPDFNLTSDHDYHEARVRTEDLNDPLRRQLSVHWAAGGVGTVFKADCYLAPEAACAAVLKKFEAKLARLRNSTGTQ